MEEIKDKHRIRIVDLLKSHPEGLTITDIMKKTDLARHTILARLHNLIGQDKVKVRQISMAKLHSWKGEKEHEQKKTVQIAPIQEEHITKVEPKPKKQIEKKEIPKKPELKEGEEIKWTPEMSVNEDNIDQQHQKLLNQINILINTISSRSKIDTKAELKEVREVFHFLYHYIKDHLSYEENYMQENNYPDFDNHKKIHDGFIKFFEEFRKEFYAKLYKPPKPPETISGKLQTMVEKCRKFLGQWWMNHILTIDHKYAEYISGEKPKPVEKKETPKLDMAKIKQEIAQELAQGKIEKHHAQIKEQRMPIAHAVETAKGPKKIHKDEFVNTGIPGFDDLFEDGIPKGTSILVAGGAGSGKTIFCLQTLNNHASRGKKCLYMSFEESEERLMHHMEDFGWAPKELIKKKNLLIKRFNPFDITRSVEGMLEKEKGELLIELDPIILPENFKPDFVVVDSLTAIASAFTRKEESYRIYIEQLFRFFEKIGATAFLITETKQIPTIFSQTGVEEFLADGVIVLYNIKRGNIRENAIEVLKLRGAEHKKQIVAFEITDNGMIVYPEQEVFGGLEGS